jgi:hypothetical protein
MPKRQVPPLFRDMKKALRAVLCCASFMCGSALLAQAPELRCKLTTDELRQRKATVLASLKTQVLERSELASGFAYRFDASDKLLDELTEFIKTERECCDFFVFNVRVTGEPRAAWLELTGPEGTKEVIRSELDL